jgi:hypothetical protein
MNTIRIIEIDILNSQINVNNKIKRILIMKITKQNETFNLVDATDMFETSGTVICDVFGSVNIHFNVVGLDGEHMGSGYYNKYGDNSMVDFGVNCSEEKRDELTAYADTLFDSVLDYFKPVE